jgi:cell filamentation protein
VTIDLYVYPGTACLRNRAGIRDPELLARLEGNQATIITAQLERAPLQGRYDLEHLQAFHRRIFGDVYDWAGELRTVAIARSRCKPCSTTSSNPAVPTRTDLPACFGRAAARQAA